MSDVTHAPATSTGVHRVDKDASSNQDPHAEFHVPMSTYTIVIIVLMVLLIITVIAAFLPLGALNMPVAMLIASVKAILVILYFMHVKFSSRLTKVFVAATFVWLAILFVMTFMDYYSRDWLSNSRGWNQNPVKSAYDKGSAGYHQGHGAEQEHTKGTEGKHSPTQTPAASDKAPGRPGSG